MFKSLDRPAMRALPAAAYEYAEWKKVRVNIDYHIAIEKHYYSVPYQLVKQQLEARVTASTVELFHKAKRIGNHRRSYRQGAQLICRVAALRRVADIPWNRWQSCRGLSGRLHVECVAGISGIRTRRNPTIFL